MMWSFRYSQAAGFGTRVRVSCLSIFLLFSPSAFGTTSLDVVTFNARWFGAKYNDSRAKNPRPVDPKKYEERARIMRDFIAQVVRPQDVVAFEEIIDMQLLQSVMPRGWNCISYPHQNESHQRVAFCASANFRFMNVPYDNNTAIEEVASDGQWSRPALRVDLVNAKGQRVVRLVGVHLKAMLDFSAERIRQTKAIADDLRQSHPVPTILTGDFNTFWWQQTKNEKDDIEYITAEMKKADATFTRLRAQDIYTYRSYRYRSQFDHFLVNGGVTVVAGPEIFAVCNQGKGEDGDGFLNFPYYYKFISDHCPVRIRVEVP